MKSLFCTVFLFVGCVVFVKAHKDNDNWPCYLKKCSRNDPDLNKCLLDNGNRALEFLFPGDAKAGIPCFLPLAVDDLSLGTKGTFKMQIDGAKINGINHIFVSDMNWNFKAKTVKIKLTFNNAIVIAGNYIYNGTFLNRPMKGKGHADLIFIGGDAGANISYSMNYELLKIFGKDYVQTKQRKCVSEEGFRVNFNNEWTSEEKALADREFFNKHSVQANEMVHDEGINELICKVVDSAMNPIFYNFDIDTIFNSN